METYDIRTDIKIGKQIFDNIPNDIKPGWAGLILSRFDNYIKNVPKSILDLYPIIDNQERWKEAHNQFSEIRMFGLNNKNYEPNTYLQLAEKVAKITYNASGESAPFDSDSGWYIPSLALKTVLYFNDARLEDEIKSSILIFNRNKTFKDNLGAAKEFITYKKIDDILWFDWDPIGVNDLAPRDEYQSYVPDIFNLKKSGASREEIAKKLFYFETVTMGMGGTLENCLTIADKIISVK